MTDSKINNNININFIYHMDFDFIKVITIKNIFNEIDYLVNIYNKEIRDIIIKIFIYYKKYKNKLFESYINLIECLSKLEYIDHCEYLKIIINIIQILINRTKIELIINDFNIKLENKNDYINIRNFNIKIKKFITINLFSNNLLKNIILFLNNQNDEEQINNISTLLATEYYMYYDGLEMYNLFCFLIKNGKSQFIKKYDSIIEKINNLNDNNNSIITKKYKYNFKNNNIKNLMETLIKINNII